MVSFPYHSHIFRDSYGSGMGIVLEAYHKGVPLLGVPEKPIENGTSQILRLKKGVQRNSGSKSRWKPVDIRKTQRNT